MPWFTYILRCKDNSFYTGITNNLIGQIIEHNRGKGSKYLRGRRPVALVHYEEFPDKSKARKREIKIKSWHREKKENLVSLGRKASPRFSTAG